MPEDSVPLRADYSTVLRFISNGIIIITFYRFDFVLMLPNTRY